MIALTLTLALTATSRHVAVVPANAEVPAIELGQVVRDALRAAGPLDRFDTQEDLERAVRSRVNLGNATSQDADTVCGIACDYGRDGLITFERLVIDGRVFVKLSAFHPEDAAPLGEVVLPVEQTKRAAALAVQLLSKHQ